LQKLYIIYAIIFIVNTLNSYKTENNVNYNIDTYEKSYVQYPVLSGLENQDEINELISNEVDNIINYYRTYDLSGENGEYRKERVISYKITNRDDEMLAVCFKGYVVLVDDNVPNRPQAIFNSFSIDLKTASIIELNKIINVEDDSFVDYFIENANKQLNTRFPGEDVTINHVFSNEQIKNLLKNADVRREISDNSEKFYAADSLSYISGEYLVIRFSVLYVLGQIWDFYIPLDETVQWQY